MARPPSPHPTRFKSILMISGSRVKPDSSCILITFHKAGAYLISPFIGRLDDVGEDGMTVIHQIRQIYDNYGFKTKILAASVRHSKHMVDCALAGADVATVPFNVIKGMLSHPLTDSGLKKFVEDYKKAFPG